MLILLVMSSIIFFICTILMVIAFLITKKTFMDREKNSPFECGFDPKSSSRMPFSLHFFLIAMIFLIFDVEITLIFPLIMIINISNMMNYIIISIFLILILTLGLFHEWRQGALNWVN
nr:NADH dehydrogenase subunit 3 [Neohydnus sinensis]